MPFDDCVVSEVIRNLANTFCQHRYVKRVDPSLAQSTIQRGLLDRLRWQTKSELSSDIFERTEGYCNHVRRYRDVVR